MKPEKNPLFHKVHLQLTLLCSAVTILILTLTTTSWLLISEKNLKENAFSSFQSDMNTLLSALENQTVITHQWLSKIEGDGSYIIGIQDNGTDLLWGNIRPDASRQALLQTGWSYFYDHYEAETAVPFHTTHTEFVFPSESGAKPDYYGCAAFSGKENGMLSILILKPLSPLYGNLQKQRLRLLLLVLTAGTLFVCFFFYFIRKLLVPIEQNRLHQIRFVAAASHELRTPLSVILSAAEACGKADSKQQAHFFRIIREEGKHMSGLISDLLSLAGADSRGLALHLQPLEPDTLLLDTYEAFEPLAREKGYPLFAELPDEAFAPICCDRERIHQALCILLHNAFSHTPAGTCIRLSLRQEKNRVLFSVSDNGPGIPASDRERIFERFYRGDASRSSATHFGLGLSIAREILTAHGGSLTAAETPGGGATFTLGLPR